MKPWILGALLSGGLMLTQTLPADAQVTFSFGRSPNSPSVTFGQPYSQYNNGYYNSNGQPGFYNPGYVPQQGNSTVPRAYSNNYVSPYPPNTYYNSAYRGYTTAPQYAPNTYAPAPSPYSYSYPYQGSNGSGYYGSQGVYLNIPRVGSLPVR